MKNKNIHIKKYFLVFIFFCIFSSNTTYGQSNVNTLQNQIDTQRREIVELDRQIEKQRLEINKVQGEANTLNNTISVIEGTRKKILTEINRTESEMKRASLTIDQLALQIDDSQDKINLQREALAQSLRTRYQRENQSLLTQLLESKNISDFWRSVDTLSVFTRTISGEVQEVREFKKELARRQDTKQAERNTLASLTEDLSGQRQAVETTKQEQQTLLTKTKNKEAEFQKLLQDKVQQKKAFESELFNYQAQLKQALNKDEIPQESALLSWPLSNVILTQRFGKTVDSGRLYASGTHNGIDMGTPVGTKIMSAAGGTVIGIGNTDAFPGCYSYGKWVLVEHPSGLSTLYAHMSSISVSSGQAVTRGQTLGLSGNTGYSTGPHLHMTLFASRGVQVSQYSQSNGCKQATIPLPTKTNAYLDPMAYLPAL